MGESITYSCLLICSRDNIGYPIVECAADGKFIISKPPNTGGVVSPMTVAEQVNLRAGFVQKNRGAHESDPLQENMRAVLASV